MLEIFDRKALELVTMLCCNWIFDNFVADVSTIEALFHEELGLVLEVKQADVKYITEAFAAESIPCHLIGHSLEGGPDSLVWCL